MYPFIKQLVAAKAFHHFIVAVIVLAGVVAGLETNPVMMEHHGAILLGLDQFILTVFVVEALLKMAAHGRQPWRYFADGWNVFDFLIIVLCLVPVGGPVAGIHLFGAHDPKNFGSLPAAFLSLFRLVTLDNWADLFNGQLPHVPGIKVALYFVTFILFGTMIIMNLFIGIIMNSMAEMHAEIAERDRAEHERATGSVTLADELKSVERELEAMQTRVGGLRRKWSAEARQLAHPETMTERAL